MHETDEVVRRARIAKTYNNLTERTAKQSALVLVSVDILREVLKVNIDKESIRDFMEKHSLVNNVEQVSIGKRAMEWMLQFLSKNHTQFISEDGAKEISNCRGRLQKTGTVILETGEESSLRLYVTETEFQKILKEGKFSEKVTVLKEWKKMGYLKAQSDRYVSKVKIVGNIETKGYIIQLPVANANKSFKNLSKSVTKKEEYEENSEFLIKEDDDIDFPEDHEEGECEKNE